MCHESMLVVKTTVHSSLVILEYNRFIIIFASPLVFPVFWYLQFPHRFFFHVFFPFWRFMNIGFNDHTFILVVIVHIAEFVDINSLETSYWIDAVVSIQAVLPARKVMLLKCLLRWRDHRQLNSSLLWNLLLLLESCGVLFWLSIFIFKSVDLFVYIIDVKLYALS